MAPLQVPLPPLVHLRVQGRVALVQSKLQVAPLSQFWMQPPAGQVDRHSDLSLHVKMQLPLGHASSHMLC